MKRIVALVLTKFVTAVQFSRSLEASMRQSSTGDESNTKSKPLRLSGHGSAPSIMQTTAMLAAWVFIASGKRSGLILGTKCRMDLLLDAHLPAR